MNTLPITDQGRTECGCFSGLRATIKVVCPDAPKMSLKGVKLAFPDDPEQYIYLSK